MSLHLSVSIIIPTLNEARVLPTLFDHLKKLDPQPLEVIVVDGGSRDETIPLILRSPFRLIKVKDRGRALQLDAGARSARGELLLFIHADTLTPKSVIASVVKTLEDPKVALGGFVSVMKGDKVRYWFSFLNYIKTYSCPLFYRPKRFVFHGLKLLFGDQVMFCRKADYLSSGGFEPGTQVMEEAAFCLRMNRLGRIKLVHKRVYSSDRRVAYWGFWKANRIYWYIVLGWAFGVSDKKLGSLYEEVR